MSMIDFNTSVDMDSSRVNSARKKNTDQSIFSLDDFYTLFAKQLQNQDMMNPADDSQFLAQMAQMATVQAMEQMNQMTMTSYAFEFLGKNVIAVKDGKDGQLEKVEGVVEKVTLYNGEPQVFVNGEAYPMGQIMEVLHSAEQVPEEKPGTQDKIEETEKHGESGQSSKAPSENGVPEAGGDLGENNSSAEAKA